MFLFLFLFFSLSPSSLPFSPKISMEPISLGEDLQTPPPKKRKTHL